MSKKIIAQIIKYYQEHPKSQVREIATACGVAVQDARRVVNKLRGDMMRPILLPVGASAEHGLVWTQPVKPPRSGNCEECRIVDLCRMMVAFEQAEAGCFRVLRDELPQGV